MQFLLFKGKLISQPYSLWVNKYEATLENPHEGMESYFSLIVQIHKEMH